MPELAAAARPANPALAGAPRRWRPAPLIRLSFALHGGGVVALLLLPEWWLAVLGTLAANHLVLCAAVLGTRSAWLGPNLTRLPRAAALRREVSLSFDDGPDPLVTPQVLDLLDRHHAKASFFCVGQRAAAHPELLREIVRRGHSVENHSHQHSPGFSFYGYDRLGREVDAAQGEITAITGHAPLFFRAPAGFRSPLLDPVLARRGLTYISWTRRGYDAVERDPSRVLARLAEGLDAGDVLLLHDGGGARDAAGTPVVLTVLPALLEQIAARGLKPVALPAAYTDLPG
jgi:peptidoglycan/xylan/chitin deacetylase (PgdA/CDA1 family)